MAAAYPGPPLSGKGGEWEMVGKHRKTVGKHRKGEPANRAAWSFTVAAAAAVLIYVLARKRVS
jgi:hypothetical protein